MSWITSLLRPDKIIGQIGGVIDNLHTSQDEKNAAKLAMEKLIQARESEVEETIRTELAAKERVLVAELQQGDKVTKWARPSVIYMVNTLVLWNYAIAPSFNLNTVEIPTDLWYVYGGILSTYMIGRSAEKRGARSKLVSTITGSKLLD